MFNLGRIRGLFFVVLLVVVGLCGDGYGQAPITGLSIVPVFAKYQFDYRAGQHEGTINKTLIGIHVEASIMQYPHPCITYSFLPQWSSSQVTTTPDYLKVGELEISNVGQQEKTNALVNITVKPTHRFYFGPGWAGLRPLVMVQRSGFEILATGNVAGDQVEGQESFQKTFVGYGGALSWQFNRNAFATLRCVGSSHVLRWEAQIDAWVAEGVALTGGYQGERLKWDELVVRSDLVVMGVKLAF